jgi:threonine/homoserine/homoserine lactone efflux protein
VDTLLTLPQFTAFLAAATLVTLAPGPDNLMVLSLGMARGRLAGIAFGLGCALGCLNHTLLAALGVGALIVASPVAFNALRIAGGLYLAWIGFQAMRHARPLAAVPAATQPGPMEAADTPAQGASDGDTPRALFFKGLVANAINPKVILFFLAFLPQFVDGSRGNAAWQIVALGVVFTMATVIIFGSIGWAAGNLGERLARHPATGAWLDRLAGGIFIALGVRLLLSN